MPRSRKRHSARQDRPSCRRLRFARTSDGFWHSRSSRSISSWPVTSSTRYPSPNPTSRALPVLTLYEEGRYAIDTYEKFTMDKSFVNGHYYSDKAPLTTWIVLPFYGALKLSSRAGARRRKAPLADGAARSAICFAGPSRSSCSSGSFSGRLIRETSPKSAVMLSMSPLNGSFVFAVRGRVHESRACWCAAGRFLHLAAAPHPSIPVRLPPRPGRPCGISYCACAANLDSGDSPPAGCRFAARSDTARRRELVRFVLGGIPCVVALLWYNHAITGSFVKMPYDYEVETAFSEMRSGYGITLPQPSALWGLLFSTYRGMFFYAPALIVVAFSYLLTRGPKVFRDIASTPLGVLTIAYLLLISSYFVWWGGWAYGPRHLIPLAMLLFYEGLPMLARTGGYRGWIYSASVVGLGMVWVAKSTALYIMPEQFSNPVFDIALPAFLNRQLRHDALPTMLFGTDPWVASWMWIGFFAVGIVGLCTLARPHRATLPQAIDSATFTVTLRTVPVKINKRTEKKGKRVTWINRYAVRPAKCRRHLTVPRTLRPRVLVRRRMRL